MFARGNILDMAYTVCAISINSVVFISPNEQMGNPCFLHLTLVGVIARQCPRPQVTDTMWSLMSTFAKRVVGTSCVERPSCELSLHPME